MWRWTERARRRRRWSLLERLQAWGVQRVFGYPGDGINGVFGALPRAEDAAVVRQTTKQSVLDLLPGRG